MPLLSVSFRLPFDEAIRAARSRKVVLPKAFYALPAEKRAEAFSVSGLAALDQVQGVLDEMRRQLEAGGTFADFKRWAATRDLGLAKHHLETVYRNGVQSAYNAGHWRRFEEDADSRPYLMYDAINDSRTRPAHRALDGVIKPVGDSYWNTHSAPMGHRCRCRLVSLTPDQARARGGVTQNPPAEGRADEGWGGKPTDAFRGLRVAIDNRLKRCDVQPALARKPRPVPQWCSDGPHRDHALMQQAWANRSGAMPDPRALVLPALSYGSPEDAFAQFMERFGGGASAQVVLPSDDVVAVSSELFRTLDGRWKITKRGRAQWLMYLAELIRSPQEIWRLKLGGSEELYLLGRFQRGRQRLDSLAVFKRNSQRGPWTDGKTAYTFEDPKGIDKKRAEIMNLGSLVWTEL